MDKRDITLKNLRSRDMVIRSLRISLVIGTILVLINPHALFSGNITSGLLLRILLTYLLTYLVPYAVSSYSSYCALRDAKQSTPGTAASVVSPGLNQLDDDILQ